VEINMSDPCFIIPISRMSELPIEARSAIYNMFGMSLSSPLKQVSAASMDLTAVPVPALVAEEGPPELTVAMIRKLTKNPIATKTLAMLRAIATSPTPKFDQNHLVRSVEGVSTYRDLAGSWSGITRRVRLLLDDASAYLVWWDLDETADEGADGQWTGRVSKLTHDALRTYFNL
jgi:hypothetical protein